MEQMKRLCHRTSLGMFVFEKIEERDVDLVMMRSFAAISGFANLFLRHTEWATANVIHVEHSFTDPELGESDVTVIVELNGTRYGLLIENKIDAIAMPNQCLRYQKRGEVGVAAGQYSDFAVFITAPQSYLDTNPEAAKYPNQITYEEMLEFFEEHGDEFESEAIRCAIKKKESGYMVQEIPSITLFWQKLYEYTCASNYTVEMYPAVGAKGSRSTWPQFRVPLQGTALYYKATPGVVDLQFSGKLNEGMRLKADLKPYLDEDMHWENTGGSISLRLKVKPMELRNPFEQYQEEVELMMSAVERLTAVAVKLNDDGYAV